MTNNQQKDEWKKEAEQLKKDLDNRQKIIKKREVKLSFGKKSSKNKPKSNSKSNAKDDHYFRQAINWNDIDKIDNI